MIKQLKYFLIFVTSAAFFITTAPALAFHDTAHKPGGSTLEKAQKEDMQRDERNYRRGIRVTASPFLGVKTLYDVNALLVNQPSINEDLVLLEQHAQADRSIFKDNIYAYPYSPLINISGNVLPQIAPVTENYNGSYNSKITLSGAEIDLGIYASRWITGYLSLAYADTTVDHGITLKRGWVTVGNLNELPLYATVGQMYVPFGSYSSNILSTPITQAMFRINAPTAILGGVKQIGAGTAYSQIFAFQPKVSASSKHGDVIDGFGANIGYKGTYASQVGYDVGVGYINNIANAAGQLAVTPESGQFSSGSPAGFDNRRLVHNVGGINVRAKGSWRAFHFVGELLSAVRSYATADMGFAKQGQALQGAHPMALHLEGNYLFDWNQHSSGIFLAYDRSWQGLALSVPQQSIATGVSSSIWHYTVATIEYRYNDNYKQGDIGSIAASGPVTSAGGHENKLLLQLGLYF